MSEHFYTTMNQTKNWKTENFPAEVYKVTQRIQGEEGQKEDGFSLYILKVNCFVNSKFDHSELIFLQPVNEISEIAIAIPNALMGAK
jgi:hypothetical protein